jgi:hypothetical protein
MIAGTFSATTTAVAALLSFSFNLLAMSGLPIWQEAIPP